MTDTDTAAPDAGIDLAKNPIMALDHFHPAVAAWFAQAFPAPTLAQVQAWPAIASGHNALIAAPTGSGKTLAAFLAALDDLVRRGIAGDLGDETAIVYVSPLKALSNDVRINLQVPIEGIRAQLEKLGYPDVDIRTFVRTGDTPQAERDAMRKRPPHIVVTTPESLYILLGSESGRAMLASTRSVIVDEIHAIVQSKRGAHLALTLERLDALCGRRVNRVGLSATQKPIDAVAHYLVGHGGGEDASAAQGAQPLDAAPECKIIDVGYMRDRDLALELPPVPLAAVMSGDAWALVHQRLAELIQAHRTTLIFVNTRRMAERVAKHLSDLIGKDAVTSHHGSLAREQRLAAEQRLKRGELRALVATASLELGIDIGDVELVCQLASPRSISTFLQRVGRANHSVDGKPKGRLFPLSRDDLVECSALLDAVRRGELDTLHIERDALDVLAQQVVAEVSCREWNEDALFALVRRAEPYRDLSREKFAEICRMLAEGYTTRRGPCSAYLHRDAVNGELRARRGARLTAITSGGAIPDTADYEVVLEPQSQMIGTVHEDFAVESMAGDIFQLGNTSYRVLRVERGRLRVEDAKGAPPSMPFWLGEAPGRTDALSFAVSRLRQDIGAHLAAAPVGPRQRDDGETEYVPSGDSAMAWLRDEVGLGDSAARQLVDYLGATQAALGLLPTQTQLAMERFFDESGGTQLIIHSPFGSRMNRAWGLALRKRFCRTFNFELQAAATEDAIVLSLSTSHSFPLDEVSRYLHSNTAEHVLVQALLDAPMFGLRWRWNAVTALALPRFVGGSKVPPQLQRMKSEDLLATVFPDQVACLENIVGEREIPDHPLVAQTMHDCLHEAMDVDALLALLGKLERGEIRIVARDLTAPSPLAAEILTARPYAFLDDAPLEERRTQAVQGRRWGDVDSTDDFARLDPEAIAGVREEAWPEARNADELHDAMMSLGYVTEREVRDNAQWAAFIEQLVAVRRATRLDVVATEPGAVAPAATLWIAAERLPQFALLHPAATPQPAISAPAEYAFDGDAGAALVDVLRGRLTGLGPTLADTLARELAMTRSDVDIALMALERQGFVMRGAFTPEAIAAVQGDAAAAGTGANRASDTGVEADAPHDGATAGEAAHDATADAWRRTEALAKRSVVSALVNPEWCERHLLARIHRYTVNRLRREIEPVEPRDFMRFLFDWQRVAPGTQVGGPDALAAILAQLEGFEAPAGAWESEILPARIDGYEISWLDDLCLAGRVVWTRLRTPPARADEGADARPRTGAGPVRATPIVLLQRRHLATWNGLGGGAQAQAAALSSRAQAVADALREHGASFFDELLATTRLLQTELEDALAELVAAGMINSDSFAGLRALLVPPSRRPSPHRRRGARRGALLGIADAGRWALLRRPAVETGPAKPSARSADPAQAEALEQIVRTLLKRYGVLCWRLIAREAPWLPPWRELLRVCHRLEARGEIRGGRFIAGLTGEQFALPEAIAPLRAIRNRPRDGSLVSVCGADPLNLVGHVVAGAKVPTLTQARVLYRDGTPIATLVAGTFTALIEMDDAETWAARKRLLQGEPEAAVAADMAEGSGTA